MPLPTGEWAATLDRMTEAIATSLSELDRHEAAAAPGPEGAGGATPVDQLFSWLERRLGAWDAKLTEAAGLAAAVEAQLADRETAFGRWHDMFRHWRDLIENGVRPPAAAGEPHNPG
jgi:hypothetical protein